MWHPISFIKKITNLWQIRRDPVGYARSLGVIVGEDCRFIDLGRKTFGTEPYLITLGNHVTISGGTRFINHDGGVWIFREKNPDIDVFGTIVVGNNVFIGAGSIILPSVEIGDNCVIGAGAVVTRDIPGNTIAAGVPARPIKSKEKYQSAVLRRSLEIKKLSKTDKRSYLLSHFKGNFEK